MPDPFDPHWMFVVGRVDGKAVGVAQATMIDDAFPHAEFLVELMKRPELKVVRAAVATVNAVAALPSSVDGRCEVRVPRAPLLQPRRLEREGTEAVADHFALHRSGFL